MASEIRATAFTYTVALNGTVQHIGTAARCNDHQESFKPRDFIVADLRCGSAAARLLGITGSKPAGGVEVCLLFVQFVVRYRSLHLADHSSRGVLPSVVCLSVIVKPR